MRSSFPSGRHRLWGSFFLCPDCLSEHCFTTLAKHPAIVKSRADSGNVPQDCGTVACAEDVVLAAYKEAAVTIAATLQVIL